MVLIYCYLIDLTIGRLNSIYVVREPTSLTNFGGALSDSAGCDIAMVIPVFVFLMIPATAKSTEGGENLNVAGDVSKSTLRTQRSVRGFFFLSFVVACMMRV